MLRAQLAALLAGQELVVLSEGMPKGAVFSRQLRRKYERARGKWGTVFS